MDYIAELRKKKQQEYISAGKQSALYREQHAAEFSRQQQIVKSAKEKTLPAPKATTTPSAKAPSAKTTDKPSTTVKLPSPTPSIKTPSSTGASSSSDSERATSPMFRPTPESTEPKTTLKSTVAQNLSKGALQQSMQKVDKLKANQQVRTEQRYQRYDIDAAQKQIDALKAQLKSEKSKLAPDRTVRSGKGSYRVKSDRTHSLGGSPAKRKELESQIKSLEGEVSRAKQVQKAYSFASVWDDPNFEATAQKGAAKKGNVVVNSRAHKNPQGHRGRAGGDSHFTDVAYSNMTDAEVKTYNYLYETDEKQAKEYLSFIRETLNQRQGVKEGKMVREDPFAYGRIAGTLSYGVGSGLDQFGSGVAQFLSPDRLPTSATQYGSAYIRQDLAVTGPKLPDWAGGASLGQAAYDTVTTMANMAPSILLTALAGPAGAGASVAAAETLGSATIGLSAAGNAYNQALAEGHTKTEARLYSTMIGASEAYLQKTFGGITAFGGSLAHWPGLKVAINNLDGSLKRLSANLAVKMLSEGSEEYAQDILDPVFRNWFYGEKNDVKLWTPEATYSFLLGAVTSLGLEGVGTVRSEIELNRQGAQIKGAHFEKDLINSALSLDKETEAYQTAKNMRSGTVKDNTHNVGELFNQYVRAGGDLSIFDAPVSASEVNAETAAQTNTTLDAVTSALMEIDMGGSKMSLKTAREKADIIKRYMDGELLTPKEINKLNLTDQNTRGVFEEFTTVQLPEDFNRLSQSGRTRAVLELQRHPLDDTGAGSVEMPATQPLSSAQETQAASEGNFTPEAELAAESAAEAQSGFDSAHEEIISYEDFANQLRELYPDVADEDISPFYEQYVAELAGQQNGSRSEETITVGGVDYPMNFSEFEQFMQQMSDQTGMPLPTEGSLREMFDAQLALQRYSKQSALDAAVPVAYNGINESRDAQITERSMNHGEAGTAAYAAGEDGARSGSEPQRADRLAAEGRGEGVQRGTEEAGERRAPARVRAKMLRDSVRNAGIEEQSAREVGVAGGTDKASLRVVPETLYTDEMRSVLDECAAQGVAVQYFTGYLNVADGDGGSFSARAAISADGKQMWVKADHADYSVNQLVQHEMFHREAAAHPDLLDDALASIAETNGEAELQKMVTRYVQQYGWTNRSAREVMEEICADAAAGIDIFNLPDAVSHGAADFAEPVRRAVTENSGGVDSDAMPPYNKYRKQPLGKEARTALKRMQQGETLSYDELVAIPEIDEAMHRPQEKPTYDLPNREKIREEAKRKTLERGSYSGEDANGNAKYDGSVKQGRRMDIVIGLPGSGKSSVYSDGLSAEHHARISDVDDVRPFIPEYNGTNAAAVHAEAKVVSDAALNEALRRGDNIVLSIVGDNVDKLRTRIQEYTDVMGYDVYLHLNELPNEKALNRAVSRYLTEGRWVPLNMIHEFGDKPTQVYLELTGQEGALNGEVRQRNGNVAESRGGDGEAAYRGAAEARREASQEHRAAGPDAGTGAQVQLQSAPRDGGKEVRLAGFDRYSNDVKRGEPPRLDRATSKSHDTYEKAKRAKEQVNKGTMFSTETTDAEYKDTLDSVVSLMKEHDLYVPQDVQKALDSAKPGDELSVKLKNAIYGTNYYDVFDQLWDDEKMEVEGLLDKLHDLEETSARQTEEQENSGYQSAVKNLITFMKDHGMKAPASVENAVDTLKPSAAASLALEDSYLHDPAYWELTDVEDDAFQQLIDDVTSYESVKEYDEEASALQYEEDLGEEISDEELEHLFGSTLADAEDYRPRAELMEGLQTNRAGFTRTDTPEFKRWFKDDSGRLTTEDGKPRVLLSGGARMGRTAINFDFNTKSSPGFWATESSEVANTYALGTTSKNSVTLMDAIYLYQPTREVELRNADSWVDAVDYIGEYWEHDGLGFRLVPLDQEGNIISDADLADRWALQTNLTSQEEFNANGDFAESDYRILETYPANDEGLRRFNYDIGDVIDKMGAGVRGYVKIYGSAKHTLVVDAEGEHFAYVPTGGLPKDIREASIPRKESHVDADEYVHVNDLVRYAFNNGYDAVIIDNVNDSGGLQTQYAFRDSSQIKSVYNGGEWNPNEKNFKFSQEKPSMTIEDFVKRYNEQFGEGAANGLYQTVKQMERAKARAERKLEQQKESAQAERSLNDQRLRGNATAWMIYHEKNLRTVRQEYRAKLDDARREKTAAVRDAIRETQTIERAVADVRVEAEREKGQQRLADQREKAAQKLEDTRLAERMNAKKRAAERLRVKEDAYSAEKADARDNTKLRRNAAKAALRDKRRVAEKRAAIETEQGPIDTIRKNPKERTALERAQEAASSLKTLGRSAYRAFVNQAEGIDRFAKRQKGGTLASTLVNIVGGANTTTETIYKSGLVNRAGDRIGDSMSDVFLCWDERGKHVDENKQALLQDYMLHKHNIDRMSFVAKARERMERFEAANPWVREMGAKEFAKLTAMTDAEVKKTGKAEARKIAQEYAKLLHNYSEARDKPVFPDKNGNPITAVTSAEVVEKYEAENPWLVEKADGIYEWWDQFMREWVVGDSLSEADYEAMREMYPHYVPTYRADKKALGAGNFVGMGGASVGSVVKKAKGGLSEIVNIEDSFANLANKAIRVARTNELYKNMVDTAMLDGEGLFSDMAVFDWDSTRMGRAYYTADGTEVRLDSSEVRKAEAADALERAEQAGLVKTKAGYRLSAWYDGELLSAFVSEDLFKSIQNTTGSSANDLEKGLLKIGNALTGPMKTAITGINPNFAMRNISRDLPTAIVNSISGMAFPKYWAQAAKEIGTKSERWQQYQALGGTNATYYNDQQGFAKVMSQGDSLGSKIIGKVGAFNEITEAQTRFAEYLATIDRLGDTYENRLLGIKNSAEVTVDFSRKGRYGKVINAWVPYWNPAVQGIDKVFRSVVESPDGSAVWKQATKTLGRAAMTTILLEAVLYAALKQLDRYDDWEELSDRAKNAYYCIPLADEHKFLKIPKNREWGAILGTPLMRLLEAANGRADPFETYIETSIEPNFLPGAILRIGEGRVESDIIGVSQALDLAYNKDFAGRTIVPYAYKQGSDAEQYDAETSIFARKLGEMLDFSPMQIDYVVKDYFGDFGKLFVSATSEATWSGDKTAADYAKSTLDMFSKTWQADSRASNQAMSDYYETVSNLEKLVQDRKNRLGGEAAQATVEYKTQKAMEKLYGKQITELNRSVRDMPEGEEKYRIKGQAAALAEEALAFYKQCMSGQIENPTLTADYSDLPTSLSNELIRLDGLGKDYSFKPGNYTPTKYNDPRKKNYVYILDDEQKDKYKETYREVYAELMGEAMNKGKYRSGTDIEKAEILESTRDDVTEETRDRFLDWLRDNYRSTKKDKK